MKTFLSIVTRFYAFLLRLYPSLYREEFAEEMLLDFSEMAADAREKGRSSFVLFCLREFVDFPFSLLMAHLKEGRMFKVLRSQPVNYGLRGAFGFGIGLATATLIGWQISIFLFSAVDPLLQNYSIWYYETFQNERWIWLFDNVIRLLISALTGMFFGLLFALLAGDHRKRGIYWMAGSLVWFIPDILSTVMSSSFGWSFFLSTSQMNILGKLNLVLEGMFYSAALVVAESAHKNLLRRLAMAAVLYPLGAYLYIKLLFFLWLEITPWFFPALMILMLILLGGLFAIVARSDRKSSLIIMAGGVAYPILFYALLFLVDSFLPAPVITMGGVVPHQNIIIDLTLTTAITKATIGLCFGLLLGLILGFQKINNPPQIAT